MDTNNFTHVLNPRTNSISDLFQTPPLKYPKRISSINTLYSNNTIQSQPHYNGISPSQHFISNSQYQYQLQKNKMQNPFQFSNGEQFTPKRLQYDLQIQNYNSNIFNSTESSPFSPRYYENENSMISLEPDLIENIIVTPITQISHNSDVVTDSDDILLERIKNRKRKLRYSMIDPPFGKKTEPTNIKPLEKHNSLINFASLFKKFKKKSSQHSKIETKIKTIPYPLKGKTNPKLKKVEAETLQCITLAEPIDVGKNMDINISEQSFMDTDLLFDSLLLKVNKPKTPHILTSQTFPILSGMDKETLTSEHSNLSNFEDSETDLSSIFDDSLISDFGLLGDMITLRSPPPRSNHRPKIASIENAKRFYHSKLEFKDFINRLNMDFENVIVYDTVNEIKNNYSIPQPQYIYKHNVRFASNVYISKVATKEEYDRCDHIFLRNRQLLNNPDFVDSIKWEINEFKKNEMVVNKNSIQFTQFFM
ncbi:hypothetical protein MOUN0_I06986 [Monosporozyma unispora]|nr:hypothetical protein C6P44_002627 [Kazachstania unispora]